MSENSYVLKSWNGRKNQFEFKGQMWTTKGFSSVRLWAEVITGYSGEWVADKTGQISADGKWKVVYR